MYNNERQTYYRHFIQNKARVVALLLLVVSIFLIMLALIVSLEPLINSSAFSQRRLQLSPSEISYYQFHLPTDEEIVHMQEVDYLSHNITKNPYIGSWLSSDSLQMHTTSINKGKFTLELFHNNLYEQENYIYTLKEGYKVEIYLRELILNNDWIKIIISGEFSNNSILTKQIDKVHIFSEEKNATVEYGHLISIISSNPS